MLRNIPLSVLILILSLLVSACGSSPLAPTQTTAVSFPASPSPSRTSTATLTRTPTITQTPTPTQTSTHTSTPTRTTSPTTSLTPTITPSPTYSLPTLVVKMQSNCRYGPGTAYLYAWGMYAGDTATVWGRNSSGTWLWIQPDNINYQCWISSSLADVTGDIFMLYVAPVRLPHSTLYSPPTGVTAQRDGDSVTVSWKPVHMTEDDDRGYMIEANVCQGGSLVWMAIATSDTTYTFTDETSCTDPSNGLLYTVEKHGYTDPVSIPWP